MTETAQEPKVSAECCYCPWKVGIRYYPECDSGYRAAFSGATELLNAHKKIEHDDALAAAEAALRGEGE